MIIDFTSGDQDEAASLALARAIFAEEVANRDAEAAAHPGPLRAALERQDAAEAVVRERDERAALRAQQDAAFQASLAADQIRAAEERAAEAERAAAEAEARAVVLAEVHRREERAAQFSLAAASPADGGIGVALRLRTGEVVRRRFPGDAHVGHLLAWTDTLEPPDAGRYLLQTTFPTRTVDTADEWRRLADAHVAGALVWVLTDDHD